MGGWPAAFRDVIIRSMTTAAAPALRSPSDRAVGPSVAAALLSMASKPNLTRSISTAAGMPRSIAAAYNARMSVASWIRSS